MTSAEDMKAILTEAFLAGVKAAHPDAFLARDKVRKVLIEARNSCTGRVLVLGAGKAAAAVAAALEQEWAGGLEGLVVTQSGYEVPTKTIEVAIGGHPYPESQSTDIAQRMLEMASQLTSDDLLFGLWSGGGSALLACPPPGVPFELLRDLTKRLLKSGADIHEINTVRKHFSQIAGGRLAKAAAPARLLNLIIPDVTGMGDTATLHSAIASGPCVPDTTSLKDAAKMLKERKIEIDPTLQRHLENPEHETPRNWGELALGSHITIVLPPDIAVDTAASSLEQQGFRIAVKQAEVTGDATKIAELHAANALANRQERAVIVTGGELTVNVTGTGIGGPNQEYALALAIALNGAKEIYALSGDTDGIDGFGEAAGAFITPDTLARMRAAGINPEEALANNDAGSAFAAIGDLLNTGPTFTNVNDLRLIVING